MHMPHAYPNDQMEEYKILAGALKRSGQLCSRPVFLCVVEELWPATTDDTETSLARRCVADWSSGILLPKTKSRKAADTSILETKSIKWQRRDRPGQFLYGHV
jgi:hypothetical protein